MIKVGPINGKPEKVFKDYHEACEYLNRMEKNKAIETGEWRWMFIRRNHESISSIY